MKQPRFFQTLTYFLLIAPLSLLSTPLRQLSTSLSNFKGLLQSSYSSSFSMLSDR